jgi:hypothetical protein
VKLLKQLERDLKKNRKKAAALGLLVLVAGWFWAPLIFKSAKNADSAAVASTTPTTTAVSPTIAAPQVAAAPTVPWQDLSDWIAADPKMHPAELAVTSERNPFQKKAETEAKVEAPPVPQPAAPVEIDPAQLGLTVTSTIVGGSRQGAMINGRFFRVGDDVESAIGVTFKLSDVQSTAVLLRYNNKVYPLPVKRGSSAARSGPATP